MTKKKSKGNDELAEGPGNLMEGLDDPGDELVPLGDLDDGSRPSPSRNDLAHDDITNRFMHYPPDHDDVVKHEHVRNLCMDIAHELQDILPESRDKMLAIRKLEEVMMRANAAIARHGG